MKGNFHIADWEIQPQINCVRRGDRSFHLEPKIMQVLVQLASHPDTVLTKEQLIHAVWPDTFVGDDVLTRSISEIRRVLEDDARAPKFIQTIPKSGYRLMVPVSFDPVPSDSADHTGVAVQPAPAVASVPHQQTRRFTPGILALAAAVVVIAVSGYWMAFRKPNPVETTSYKTVPLTSNLGLETQPSFSPDGHQIAYVWNGDGRQQVYVKLIGNETSLKLTSGAGDDFSPTWSPDGRSVAFLRVSPTDRGIFIVPAIGGAERKVFSPLGKIEWERGSLSWSPDGKRLIFPDGKSAKSPSSIYSLDLETMDARPITSPPSTIDGDFDPSFSPDGAKFAFVRGTDAAARDIYVQNIEGGEPRRLTFDNRFVSGLAWSADGASIIFSSDRAGKFSLWRVSASGGDPVRLPVGGDDAFAPAVARSGKYLAYTQRSAKWSISRIDLTSGKPVPQQLLSSTQQDSAPQFSPDGKHIAFQSSRSGSQEIWVSSSTGTDMVKLTSFEGPLTGSPAWSPDGQQLAFDSRPQGYSHIYVIGLKGGTPKDITTGDCNDIVPSWSRDGSWIYFGSNRSGSYQIWKVSVATGELRQVTKQGGFVAIESEDGQSIFYTKFDQPGVWKVPVNGGQEINVSRYPGTGFWGYWNLRGDEIYFLNNSSSSPALEAMQTTTGKIRRVFALQRVPPPFSGVTVSPDSHWLLFTDLTEAGSHITLVENFR